MRTICEDFTKMSFAPEPCHDHHDLSGLPERVLLQIAKNLNWTDRKVLSQVCHEYRKVLKPTIRALKSISLRGRESSALYTFINSIDITFDKDLRMSYRFTLHELQIHRTFRGLRNENFRRIPIRHVRDRARLMFQYFMENHTFVMIEIGEVKFMSLAFFYTGPPVEYLRVPDWPEGRRIAEHLQPTSLAIGALPKGPTSYLVNQFFDISKLPNLRHLNIISSTRLSFEQFLNNPNGQIRTLKINDYTKIIDRKADREIQKRFQHGVTNMHFLSINARCGYFYYQSPTL